MHHIPRLLLASLVHLSFYLHVQNPKFLNDFLCSIPIFLSLFLLFLIALHISLLYTNSFKMYLQHERRTLTLPGPAAPTPTFSVVSVAPSSSSTDAPIPTATVFDHSLVAPNPNPTETASGNAKAAVTHSKGINKGPIIGGVIGGVVLIALIAFGIWFFLRRRKAKEMDSLARGTTPMLGANGLEKFAMDISPEFGEERRSRSALSGGVFGPFGGGCFVF